MDKIIEQATPLLVEAAHPAKIILFGSYARGDFTEDSDLDLLMIVPSVEDHIEEMARLRLVLRELPIAMDLVVCTRADVENRGHLRGTMLYHALQEGRVLHDAA
jgi:predicted nucleotidyltransferase